MIDIWLSMMAKQILIFEIDLLVLEISTCNW